MSKSLWYRSVWDSLLSRSSAKRTNRRLRRAKRLRSEAVAVLETFEQRVLLAAAVDFDSSTNTLTIDDSAAGANSAVTIKAGSVYTDIYVNNKFQTRIVEANTNNIGAIDFTGSTGFLATLSVIGVNGPGGSVDIDLTDTDRLLLNTKNTAVTADGPLALGKSTVAGTLDVTLTGTGALTQFGKISVSGTTTLATDATLAADDIILSSSGNSFGTLILDAGALGDININEAGPTTLGDTTGAKLTVKSTGAITDNGTLAIGAGGTTLTSSSSITLDDTLSTFAGVLAAKGTNIQIDNNAAAGVTDLGNITATGTFTLTSANDVAHTAGNVKVTGAASITTDTPLPITITAGTNNFGSLSLSGSTIQITEKSAMDLDTTTATGNLVLIAKGAITDSGEVSVTGTTSLTATGSAITLDESTSTYTGAITVVTGTNVAITNDTATDLANVTAKGTFTLTSGGDVDDSATLSITGRATIDATGFDIDLSGGPHTFGSISVFGTGANLNESGATDLFTSEITGNFILNSTGAVTDSGDLTFGDAATDTTTITTTGAITLNSSGSFFGVVDLAGTNVSITNTSTTTLADVDATTFTLNSADSVDQTGPIAVTGLVTVTTPGNIVLAAANTIGSISVSGVDVTINDTAGGLDIVSATASEDLSVTTAGGALTDSGTITVTDTTTLAAGAANNITLDSAASTFGGTVTVTSGANVSIRDNDSLGLTLGGSTISGTLSLTANGDITASAATTVNNTGTSTTVALDAGSSGNISITGITFSDDDVALTMTGVDATFTPVGGTVPNVALGTTLLSGALTLTNVNNVTQTGKQTIAGTTTITTADGAGGDDINLSTVNGNTFGTLILSANDISIKEAGNTDFGTTTALAGGTLTVVSSGDVTDSGVLTIGGATSVTSNGNDITLDSANMFTGALTLSGNDITIVDSDATALTSVTASGGFTLTSGGAVTQTGAMSVTGAASVSTSPASAITLTNAGNNFGTISTSGAAVSITEASATNLGTTTAASLTVDSNGAITDSGTIAVTGAVTMDAGSSNLDAITLDNVDNTFGTLDLAGGNITIVENAATDFDAVDAAGTLSVTSAGAITQDAVLDLEIGGLATLVAFNGTSNQPITLTTATNNFSSVSATGAAVQLTDIDDIDLATTTASALTVIAGGDITDSGALTVTGLATLTAGADLTIDEAGSSFGSIDISGDTVVFIAYSGLTIVDADSNVGDLTIIASGAITDGGVARTVDATVNIFVQAGLDPSDPTRELDPNDPSDYALLNSLDLGATDPGFSGTETYIGSIVNVG